MREDAVEQGAEPLDFVGSVSLSDSVEDVAASMRETLELASGWADQVPSWIEALRLLRLRIDAAGLLVVSNGVVGNNNHRKLNPGEFGGFALVDVFAPLIFVNGADYRSRQMFTLAHELATCGWMPQACRTLTSVTSTRPDLWWRSAATRSRRSSSSRPMSFAPRGLTSLAERDDST